MKAPLNKCSRAIGTQIFYHAKKHYMTHITKGINEKFFPDPGPIFEKTFIFFKILK